MNDRLEQAKALASAARLSILDLLKEPRPHFAHQEAGDPAEIGVCVTLLTAKLGLSQPTVSRHLELLKRAGFLSVRNIGRWSYFTRNEDGIRDYKEWLHDTL
ncbi:metalloregulator ArsR/SmtB family transcription factor [Nisaea sp.]|uniref:ArsR/SmtB family transcription factor n=1 Tax=Nisaea sp. TaxID=2024842 RepID=UPI0032668904